MHVIGLMIEVGQFKEALEMLRKDVDDKILPPISDVMSLEGEHHLIRSNPYGLPDTDLRVLAE